MYVRICSPGLVLPPKFARTRLGRVGFPQRTNQDKPDVLSLSTVADGPPHSRHFVLSKTRGNPCGCPVRFPWYRQLLIKSHADLGGRWSWGGTFGEHLGRANLVCLARQVEPDGL